MQPLELSGERLVPPLQRPTTLGNASTLSLPPSYIVSDTNPHVILKINPTRREPVSPHDLTYLVMRGLGAVVQRTIQNSGDSAIPAGGYLLRWYTVSISVNSHLPGAVELTYGTTAKLLRGIWELSVLFEPCELDMEVYVGRQDVVNYRGHVALYQMPAAGETA